MDLQFQCPLLFRFVITSTITMIIETKHQLLSNAIELCQASVPTVRKPLSRAHRPIVRPKLRLFGEAATTPRRPGRIRSWPWVSRLPPALPGSCEPCSRGLLTVALVAA